MKHNNVFKTISFIYFLIFSISCSTIALNKNPNTNKARTYSKSELEKLVEKTVHLNPKAQPSNTTPVLRAKMETFRQALSKGKLTEQDWKLHDELLKEYIQLKQLRSGRYIIPKKTKAIVHFETFCLNPGKAAPSENEIYKWVRKAPSIPYYREIISHRAENKLSQSETQSLIWNLKNEAAWEEYPPKLKNILIQIDPLAPVKLPSNVRTDLKNYLSKTLRRHVPGMEEANNAINLLKGKFYDYQDYQRQIEDLVSMYPQPSEEAHNTLDPIPDTQLFPQSDSSGFSNQNLTIYNPTDEDQELDFRDFYLEPSRKDVQPIGLVPTGDSSLLDDLEDLLYETMLRLGIGFTPILNDAADLYEVLTGRDFLTNEPLSPYERSLSALGLAAGSGQSFRQAEKVANAPGKYADEFAKNYEQISQKSLGKIDGNSVNPVIRSIHNRPHKTISAEEANKLHLTRGDLPPYQSGRKVTEFKSIEGEKWVRLHQEGRPGGHWMVREEAIRNLSRSDLRKKYSLPKEPTHVSDVVLPPGTTIRRGRVESNFGGNPGAVQYEIMDTNWDPSWFTNTRTLK